MVQEGTRSSFCCSSLLVQKKSKKKSKKRYVPFLLSSLRVLLSCTERNRKRDGIKSMMQDCDYSSCMSESRVKENYEQGVLFSSCGIRITSNKNDERMFSCLKMMNYSFFLYKFDRAVQKEQRFFLLSVFLYPFEI